MRSQKTGSVIIEFSLVLVILMAFGMLVADASAAFRAKHVLQMAAREGARLASVQPALSPPFDPIVVGAVNKILQDAHVRGTSTVLIVTPDGLAPGRRVKVVVTNDYTPMFLGVVLGIGSSFHGTLGASSTMRYEVGT